MCVFSLHAQIHVGSVALYRVGEKDCSFISELALLPQTSLRRFATILMLKLVCRSVGHSFSQSSFNLTFFFFLQHLVCRPLVKILSDLTECQVRTN